MASDVERAYTRTYSDAQIDFVSLEGLIARLGREPLAGG